MRHGIIGSSRMRYRGADVQIFRKQDFSVLKIRSSTFALSGIPRIVVRKAESVAIRTEIAATCMEITNSHLSHSRNKGTEKRISKIWKKEW